jgi:serine/threonine protein kinase
VYDYGTDANGPYYVMELAGYAIEVAAALSVLHARRVVHRDVSACNVWCAYKE